MIRVGDLPTSKPLRAWLAGLDCAQIAIDPDDGWRTRTRSSASSVSAPARSLLEGLAGADVIAAEPEWLDSWRAADAAAATVIKATLG